MSFQVIAIRRYVSLLYKELHCFKGSLRESEIYSCWTKLFDAADRHFTIVPLNITFKIWYKLAYRVLRLPHGNGGKMEFNFDVSLFLYGDLYSADTTFLQHSKTIRKILSFFAFQTRMFVLMLLGPIPRKYQKGTVLQTYMILTSN